MNSVSLGIPWCLYVVVSTTYILKYESFTRGMTHGKSHGDSFSPSHQNSSPPYAFKQTFILLVWDAWIYRQVWGKYSTPYGGGVSLCSTEVTLCRTLPVVSQLRLINSPISPPRYMTRISAATGTEAICTNPH